MPRIAFLTYSTGEYDGRTQRMARTALAAGYDVIVYARWQEGLPLEEAGPGYRIVRIPAVPDLAIPWRRARGRRRLAEIMSDRPGTTTGASTAVSTAASTPSAASATKAGNARRWPWPARVARGLGRRGRRLASRIVRRVPSLPFTRPIMLFPLRPLGWAIPLSEYAEPADLWHGMWAASLPALDRLRAAHGGRTIYDSRDVYMRSRGFERMGPFKAPFAWLERRWARRADAVLTVNDAYAGLLAGQFGMDRPPVVRNTPDRYSPPDPPPDLIRRRLGLGPETHVVLYQGGLLTDRGIEQGMEAILHVPDAVLAIMGFGPAQAEIEGLAASSRYRDRVRMLEPVSPDELLEWTASADVMLMAIQPTSVNHRYTTPQKLWEAIAAGTPVVATDLPGMAGIVRETGCGLLVDATDPTDIARAIREIVDAPAADRRAMRERTWQAGQDRYNWEHESEVLLALYRRLLGQASPPPPAEPAVESPASESISPT
jgi:glycosyltransferase involved in cell wall biosynthesis